MPEPKNVLEALLEGASGEEKNEDEGKTTLSLPTAVAGHGSLWNAALPHLRGLDPRRVDAVLRAFEQLEILEREGVVLMTPEITVR